MPLIADSYAEKPQYVGPGIRSGSEQTGKLYALGSMIQQTESIRQECVRQQLMPIEAKLNMALEEMITEWTLLRRDLRTGSTR